MDGILIIDKPAGPTSHDIVQEVKRLLAAKKVGHLGTLDPGATGVLPLVVNGATKLAAKFNNTLKVYEFDLVLGIATDTDDDSGQVIKNKKIPKNYLKLITKALPEFQGKIKQVPPTYSAVKLMGEPLYKKARKGQKIQVESREVTIYDLEILMDSSRINSSGNPRLKMKVTCSSGTYVRALCRDLGEKIGCCGHAARIRRLESGPFKLQDAVIFGKFRALSLTQRCKMLKSTISFV
ncbi:MAG: tRNA pseudouridine(55) synthase TruB [Pseudomonadota bacterium]